MNIDPNTVMSQALTELVTKFLGRVRETSVSAYSKAHSYLLEDFSEYLEATLKRCSTVRTIINKDKSFELRDIYVHGVFKDSDESLSDADIIQKFRDCQHSVVLGFGGIGKTVFMKYLWLCVFDNPHGKIPVFIELRRLNQITDPDLKTYIRGTITANRSALDEAVFAKFLEEGRFSFVLDGFDELLDSKKAIVADEILSLSHSFPRNSIIVSSRNDDRFQSWQSFCIYRANSFSRAQVLELISKIPYEKSTKKKFVSDVVLKNYDEFQSFLSTPLLSLMMLMTYSQFGEVPNKRHIFYRYAFMTLYSWHDSSKEAFNRQRQTGLLLDQFEKAFSIFCLISYIDGSVSFDFGSILSYLEKAKKYLEFDYDSRIFLNEIVDNVNLLYVDGDQYLFTHRSLQEYFAAYACVNYFQSKISALVPRLNRSSDIALGLMYEINPSAMVEGYLYDAYESKKAELSKLLSIRSTSMFSQELDIRYLVGIGESDGQLALNLFGATVKNHVDDFVITVCRILDSHPLIRELKNVSVYDEPPFNMLEKFFLSKAKKISRGRRNFIFSVSSKTQQILVSEDISVRSFDDLYDEVEKTGKPLDVSATKLLEHMEESSIAMKAKYVAVDKVCRELSIRHRRVSRDIDDLLGD